MLPVQKQLSNVGRTAIQSRRPLPSVAHRLYLCIGGGALLFLLFLCFLRPIKLYQTRMVRCIGSTRVLVPAHCRVSCHLHPCLACLAMRIAKAAVCHLQF